MIVLDACVLTKLFVEEPQSAAAARLVARYSLLFAPELVTVEVVSAITRKVRNREIDRAAAEQALTSWSDFLHIGNLRLTADQTLLPEAAQFALALGHPVADCLYLALAARHQIPLVTADKPFWEATRSKSIDVRLLAEFASEAV